MEIPEWVGRTRPMKNHPTRVGAGFKPAPKGARRSRRRSIRLPGFDYAQPGAYFVTICTWDRACVLGQVVNDEINLSQAGRVVQATWEDLPRHFPHVRLDAWIVMPNHVHGIIVLTDPDDMPVGAGFKPAPANNSGSPRHGLPEIVRAFKTFSSRRINAARSTVGAPFWQRNYYEHVIRNDESLNRIRQYIKDNPARWHEDPENPAVRRAGPDDLLDGTSTSNSTGAGFKPAPTRVGKARGRWT